MKVLVDTNIVARLAQPPHPQHRSALTALDALKAGRAEMCIVPQVLYEFGRYRHGRLVKTASA